VWRLAVHIRLFCHFPETKGLSTLNLKLRRKLIDSGPLRLNQRPLPQRPLVGPKKALVTTKAVTLGDSLKADDFYLPNLKPNPISESSVAGEQCRKVKSKNHNRRSGHHPLHILRKGCHSFGDFGRF
jgi:hypothetical protein